MVFAVQTVQRVGVKDSGAEGCAADFAVIGNPDILAVAQYPAFKHVLKDFESFFSTVEVNITAEIGDEKFVGDNTIFVKYSGFPVFELP